MSLTGNVIPELDEAPNCPAGFEYLWEWYTRLDKCRPAAMEGTNGIPETEIRAYFDNRGITPEAWELRILERLDAAAVAEGHKSRSDEPDEEED